MKKARIYKEKPRGAGKPPTHLSILVSLDLKIYMPPVVVVVVCSQGYFPIFQRGPCANWGAIEGSKCLPPRSILWPARSSFLLSHRTFSIFRACEKMVDHGWIKSVVLASLVISLLGCDGDFTKTCVLSDGITHPSLWDGSCDSATNSDDLGTPTPIRKDPPLTTGRMLPDGTYAMVVQPTGYTDRWCASSCKKMAEKAAEKVRKRQAKAEKAAEKVRKRQAKEKAKRQRLTKKQAKYIEDTALPRALTQRKRIVARCSSARGRRLLHTVRQGVGLWRRRRRRAVTMAALINRVVAKNKAKESCIGKAMRGVNICKIKLGSIPRIASLDAPGFCVLDKDGKPPDSSNAHLYCLSAKPNPHNWYLKAETQSAEPWPGKCYQLNREGARREGKCLDTFKKREKISSCITKDQGLILLKNVQDYEMKDPADNSKTLYVDYIKVSACARTIGGGQRCAVHKWIYGCYAPDKKQRIIWRQIQYPAYIGQKADPKEGKTGIFGRRLLEATQTRTQTAASGNDTENSQLGEDVGLWRRRRRTSKPAADVDKSNPLFKYRDMYDKPAKYGIKKGAKNGAKYGYIVAIRKERDTILGFAKCNPAQKAAAALSV